MSELKQIKSFADKGEVLCPRCLERYPLEECSLFGIRITPEVIDRFEAIKTANRELNNVDFADFLPLHWKIYETEKEGFTERIVWEKDIPNVAECIRIVYEETGDEFEYNIRECPYCNKKGFASDGVDIFLSTSCGKGPQLLIGIYGTSKSGKTCFYRAIRSHRNRSGLNFFFDGRMAHRDDGIVSTGRIDAKYQREIYEVSTTPSLGSQKSFRAMITFRECAGEDIDNHESLHDQFKWVRKADVVLLVIEPMQLKGVRELFKDPALRASVIRSGVIEADEVQEWLESDAYGGKHRDFNYLEELCNSLTEMDYTKTRYQILVTKSNQLREIVKNGGLLYKSNNAPLLSDNCILFMPDDYRSKYYPSQTLGVSRLLWELIYETDPELYSILYRIAQHIQDINGWKYPRMAAFCTNAFEFIEIPSNSIQRENADRSNCDFRQSCRVLEPLLWTLYEVADFPPVNI